MIEAGAAGTLVDAQIQMLVSELDKAEGLVGASGATLELGKDWSAIKKTLGNAYKAESTSESLALLNDANHIIKAHSQLHHNTIIQQLMM